MTLKTLLFGVPGSPKVHAKIVYKSPNVIPLKTPRILCKTIQKDFTIAHSIKLTSLWESVELSHHP
jgi:hypothetical protein